MPRDPLTILCPAKVNLALSVGAPDRDTGMHPIFSWMVTVGFGDSLKLAASDNHDSSYELLMADDAPPGGGIDWPIESDLAFRAHGLMQQHAQKDLPINMELTKRIPAGAGLGGGSSDAAGMLVGLNRLFSLGLTDAVLIGLGLQLGSDVGFLVASQLGIHSAVVSGLGETIRPTKRAQPLDLVLIFPPYKCETAEVYRCFDRINTSAQLNPERILKLVDTHPLPGDGPFNDLSEAAFEVQPGSSQLQQELGAVTGVPVHVSGSGASMFVLADSPKDAEAISARITGKTGMQAVAAQTLT